MILTAQNFSVTDYDDSIFETNIAYNLGEVSIALYNDEGDMEAILQDVNPVVSQLAAFDAKGQELIIEELYDAYNKDGKLTEQEFKDNIELISLYFTGDAEVEFTYEGGTLFGGHFLTIEMHNGVFDGSVAMDG